MKKNIENITIALFALLMMIFGLNKFFGFIAVDPPGDPVAQTFMGAMFSTYLFKVVAVAEIGGGILMVLPKTRLVGWIVILPVIFNIVMFHIAHDFIGNGIWLLPTVLYAAISYFSKDDIRSLIK
ncbi:MAG: DoxX family protein [Bacteroidota bacterium]